jgi:DNA-binding beta-propeller fold protein YncE
MHEIFVVNYVGGDIQVFSDSNNAVVADITALTQYAGAPYDIAYDSGKGEMWIADDTGAYAISDATNTVVANVTNGLEPHLTRIAYDSGMGELFVTPSYYDVPTPNVVQVISDSTNTIVANITGGVPFAMVYDKAKGEIFVSESQSSANGGNGYIAVISDKTNSVVTTIPISNSGFVGFLAYDSGKGEIFAQTGSNTVSVISDSSNKVVATINGVNFGWEGTLAYDSGKGEIYMNGENEVEVISDSTNKVIGTVNTGFSQPVDIAYDSGTGEIFAANSLIPGTVAVISDSSSGTSTSSPSTSASTSPTSTPKVPEFGNAALTLIAIALGTGTLSMVGLARKKHRSINHK